MRLLRQLRRISVTDHVVVTVVADATQIRDIQGAGSLHTRTCGFNNGCSAGWCPNLAALVDGLDRRGSGLKQLLVFASFLDYSRRDIKRVRKYRRDLHDRGLGHVYPSTLQPLDRTHDPRLEFVGRYE